MELEGSISTNLRAAIASAERLRGHPVHRDTMQFWQDLLSHSRNALAISADGEADGIRSLIGELQSQITARELSR